MSFKAVFKFDGGASDGYDVRTSHIPFSQSVDERGGPASVVKGGTIHLSLSGIEDDKVVSWMIDPYKKVNGSITFYKSDSDSKLYDIQFTGAYCVSYTHEFSAHDSNDIINSIVISAETISPLGVKHDNTRK